VQRFCRRLHAEPKPTPSDRQGVAGVSLNRCCCDRARIDAAAAVHGAHLALVAAHAPGVAGAPASAAAGAVVVLAPAAHVAVAALGAPALVLVGGAPVPAAVAGAPDPAAGAHGPARARAPGVPAPVAAVGGLPAVADGARALPEHGRVAVVAVARRARALRVAVVP